MNIVITLIYWIFYILELLIFARCILSFLPFNNRLTAWVYSATEPVLAPCRRLIGRFNYNLPLDFSPVLALLILQFVQRIVFSLLGAFL